MFARYGTLSRTRYHPREPYPYAAFARAYLALSVLVLARSVAKAGQDGRDGLGVVQTARENNFIVVIVLSPLLSKHIRRHTNHGGGRSCAVKGVVPSGFTLNLLFWHKSRNTKTSLLSVKI